MTRAVSAIEAIAAAAQDVGVMTPGFPETTYTLDERNKVVICQCTESVHVQFDNLWAYYAPGRMVSFQEGDEELLVEVSKAIEDGTFFAF